MPGSIVSWINPRTVSISRGSVLGPRSSRSCIRCAIRRTARGLGGSTCPAGKYMGWPHVRDQVAYFEKKLVIGIQIETAEAFANLMIFCLYQEKISL